MKLLHTSDWHVGKTLRGRSRLDEHAAVLAEITAIAAAEAPDLIVVAGDVFESAAPSPEAQGLVWRTLLDLRGTGAEVVVVAGNHDNPLAFQAVRPLFRALGITLLGQATAPADGGVVRFDARATGEPVRVALLPFCSQRSVVKAAQLLAADAATNAGTYAARVADLVRRLTTGFDGDAVNVLVAHAMVAGGRAGGGERDAQIREDYYVEATAFPGSAHYVALGHLHATQRLAGACPIWYSGSPIQVDFGEEGHAKAVLVAEATPTSPATVREVPLTTPRRLRTLRGTVAELEAMAGDAGDDWLRVYVTEPARAGLADAVRELLPGAVDVYVERAEPAGEQRRSRTERGRGPVELFEEFLGDRGVDDRRVRDLFAHLLEEATR